MRGSAEVIQRQSGTGPTAPSLFPPLRSQPKLVPFSPSAIFHLHIFENTHACGWFLGHRALMVPWELGGLWGEAL